jgi:multiple sugar transport system permease protein
MRIRLVEHIIINFILVGFSLIIVFPFVWSAVSSLKTEVQMFESPPKILPHPATLKNYRDAIGDGSMFRYILNSLIVSAATTMVSLIAGIPCAYSFARYRFPLSKPMRSLVYILRIVPGVTFILPYFQIVSALNLTDTRLALLLIYVPGSLILMIIMMQNFFIDFPREIEDAGRIDGLNVVGIIIRLLIPVSLPIIATCSILTFLGPWNEYFFASVVIRSDHLKTMPMGIVSFASTLQVYWGKLLSNGFIYVLPVLVFTFFAQKGLVKGLVAGSIKE